MSVFGSVEGELSDLVRDRQEMRQVRRHFSCGLGSFRSLYRPGAPEGDPESMTLAYVLQGQGRLALEPGRSEFGSKEKEANGDGWSELVPGDVCLLRGKAQGGLAFAGEDALQVVMSVPGEIAALAERIGLPGPSSVVFHIGRRADLVTRAEKLGRALAGPGGVEREGIVMQAFEIVADIFRLAGSDHKDVGEQASMGEVCRALARDIQERLSIPELAARFHMSYTAFRREFARVMHMPPGEYRIRQRIESIKILMGMRHPIKEAAARFGYPDLQSFSKQFKQMTGLTPRQYQAEVLA